MLSAEELEAIRRETFGRLPANDHGMYPWAFAADRHRVALLKEVDRLRALDAAARAVIEASRLEFFEDGSYIFPAIEAYLKLAGP